MIGVAKSGWKLEQLRARASDSLEKHGGGVDEQAFAQADRAACATSTATTRTQRRSSSCARRWAARSIRLHYLAIPPESVRDRGRGSGAVRVRAQRRAADRRKAVRPRSAPRRRRSTGRCTRSSTSQPIFRIDHYLGKEPVQNLLYFPLRQLLSRADLEPALRRERADHHGRELRRRGPRRVLRRDRRDPRRDRRTTCCRWSASWRWSRR